MTLKRLFLIAFSTNLFLFLSPENTWANENPPIILAPHALVLDLKTNQVLFEKAADQQTSIASLTKLMVALIIFEHNDLNGVVSISLNAANTPGSTAWLYAGEHFYVNDLLMALILPSGNDAAVAFAEHVSGTTTEFLKKMNARAQELEMNNTLFGNVTGMDGSMGYSTTRDLSKLTQSLLEFQSFREIIQTSEANLISLEGTSRNIQNTNQLLGQTISGLKVVGMKTGTTQNSGQSLIVLGQDDKQNEALIILLNSTDRYSDARQLLNWIGLNIELGEKPEPKVILKDWPFPDLNSYAPEFFETMLNLKAEGIVQGDSKTDFIRGEDSLNRAEMITLLLRTVGYDEIKLQNCSQNTSKIYADVEKNLWYTQAIECASKLGWIKGDDLPIETLPSTLPTFRPGDPVTIAEGLKMIALATNKTPELIFEEPWYEPYLGVFLNEGNLEKNEAKGDLFISELSYPIGNVSDLMNRNTAFELISRNLWGTESTLSLDAYRSKGAIVQENQDTLDISDPNLHFTISKIPLGNYKLSDLKFEIKNSTGFQNDYYSTWRLVYGKTTQTGYLVNETLFNLIIYDPDYLQAGFQPFENSELREGDHYTELRCNQNLTNYDPSLTPLYLSICPEGKISDQLILTEG